MQQQKLKSADLLGSTNVEGDSDSEGSEVDPAEEFQYSPKTHDLPAHNENEALSECVETVHMNDSLELTSQIGENDNKENLNLLRTDAHKHMDLRDSKNLQYTSQK